ncbi:hypothetical protein GLX30_34345 [Streptomyces sp. Tu 2975]|uniref:hypothetical protein n=1 Tax=Streptomyces sp. Tu 2975 TaxID=2676871 RepID=UPI0013569869|nr:hypothetical protein [Streptomyces sp. Tu 2975]QIP88253.1 hypothetical protein GLX30_34345 [Streptomyces sp. Tu 2975]
MAVVGVVDGDGEGGAGGAGGGGAHAEFAEGDAVDGGEEPFLGVAVGGVVGAVRLEAGVGGLEEGGGGESDVGEGGDGVVDGVGEVAGWEGGDVDAGVGAVGVVEGVRKRWMPRSVPSWVMRRAATRAVLGPPVVVVLGMNLAAPGVGVWRVNSPVSGWWWAVVSRWAASLPWASSVTRKVPVFLRVV